MPLKIIASMKEVSAFFPMELASYNTLRFSAIWSKYSFSCLSSHQSRWSYTGTLAGMALSATQLLCLHWLHSGIWDLHRANAQENILISTMENTLGSILCARRRQLFKKFGHPAYFFRMSFHEVQTMHCLFVILIFCKKALCQKFITKFWIRNTLKTNFWRNVKMRLSVGQSLKRQNY